MTRTLFAILLSLIFCISKPNTVYSQPDPDVYYCMSKNTYEPITPFSNKVYNKCPIYNENYISIDWELWKNLRKDTGSVGTNPDPKFFLEYNKQLYEKYVQEKRHARLNRLEKLYSSKCEDGLFKKGFKKGTSEYYNCLSDQENTALKKNLNQTPNSTEANSDIAKTCLGFGYKKGTEKYADCMKDLYLQQNAANKSNSNNSSSSYSNSKYADEMLEIERTKAKALEDSARAQRNRNQSDALMDISRSLLNNNRAPATTNQPLNCRSVRVGNTVQTQCY